MLFFPSIIIHAQKDSLVTKVMHADKIVLLSHQDLHLRATIDEIKMGIPGYWRNICDSMGQLNECIVVETLELRGAALDTLKDILFKSYPSDIPCNRAACFDPHQTIILFRNGRCSYLDICFDCRQFSSSADILLPGEFLSTDEQWHNLKMFFVSKGIKSGIEFRK